MGKILVNSRGNIWDNDYTLRWMSDMMRKEADKSSTIFCTMGVESVDWKRIVWWHFQSPQDHNLNSVLFSADVIAQFHNRHLNQNNIESIKTDANMNKISYFFMLGCVRLSKNTMPESLFSPCGCHSCKIVWDSLFMLTYKSRERINKVRLLNKIVFLNVPSRIWRSHPN